MTIVRQMWPRSQPRRRKPAGGFPKAVKDLVRTRAKNLCEIDACGPIVHFHHRAARGAGGRRLAWVNRAANCLGVSQRCHDRIESYREEAYRKGWLVRRNGRDDPETASDAEVSYRGRLVLLSDDGQIHPVAGGAA